MSEFKFQRGDRVQNYRGEKGYFMGETDGKFLFISFDDGNYCRALPEGLALISRHQEWVKFDIAAQETWPPFGEFVLAVSKSDNDISQLSRFSKKGKFMISANCDDEAYYEEELIVTHWMPLPEPPKELP